MTKKNYLIESIITQGKHQYVDRMLIKTDPKTLLIDVEDIFKSIFGHDTKLEEGKYTDGERTVKIKRCRELTKEEHEVLKKFL